MNTRRSITTALLIWLCTHTTNAQFTFPLTIKPHENVVIYFGNNRDGFFLPPPVDALRKHAFSILTSVQKKLGLERFAFLKPMHGTEGKIIETTDGQSAALSYSGDYLLTRQPGLGLVKATADALPILFVDPTHHAIGITHASLKNTSLGVVQQVVEEMKKSFGTNPAELQVVFGPSIGRCCLAISQEQLQQLGLEIDGKCARKDEKNEASEKVFVSLADYNQHQLIACGVLPDNIATRFNICTCCNAQFFSSQREGSRAGRQLSVIAITN